MATTPMSTLLSPLSLSSITHLPRHSLNAHSSSLSILHTKVTHFRNPPQITLKLSPVLRISAVTADSLPSEVNPVESTELVTVGDNGGVSNIISILLFIAFVGLSVLTIGVVYIAVTDFLQKREKDRFEKEEETKNKKKKSGKKVRAKARPGPRGFGQKVEEEDEA